MPLSNGAAYFAQAFRLREAMALSATSVADLAAIAGTTPLLVLLWVEGSSTPNELSARLIAHRLGIHWSLLTESNNADRV